MKLLNFTDRISEDKYNILSKEFDNPFTIDNPSIEINEIIFERKSGSDEPQRILIKITELGQEKFYSGVLNIEK